LTQDEYFYTMCKLTEGRSMLKRNVSHWIIIGTSTLIVAFCVYVIYLGIMTSDSNNVWIFSAFGFLFSIPLLVSLFHIVAEKHPRLNKIYTKATGGAKPRRTPFVPHWFVMAGIFFIGLSLIFGIIRGILSYLSR
jgi:TRAP-type C4-dicarboxylate transport system permease small subunit